MADQYDMPTQWEQLTWPDYAMLGFTMVHEICVVFVVFHLIRHRYWPPYVTKHVTLVAATGIGSPIALVSGLVTCGVIYREPGDILASCHVEAVLKSIGIAFQFFPAFVRVYRNYTVLILHSAAMWPAMLQLQAVAWPYIVPALIYLLRPSLSEFEEYRNRCFDNTWVAVACFMYMAGGIAFAIVLIVRMRRVRKQLNEFRIMMASLAFLLVWALYLNPAGQWFWLDDPNVSRRLVMVDNIVSTVVLFWCPISVPFLKRLQQDEEYVWQYTFGFSQLPTPGQMRACLADQLEVEDLRRKFRKYAAGRVAPELPDFYKACMDREQVEGYFERQAVTMAIIDRFVAEGAEQEINISQECKRRILESEITRYNIFDEAIAEVLKLMEVNFKADFERTMEFRRLSKAVEREARELQVLRQARLVCQPKDVEMHWPRSSGRTSSGARDGSTHAATSAAADSADSGEAEAPRGWRRHSFSATPSDAVASPGKSSPTFASADGTDAGRERQASKGDQAAPREMVTPPATAMAPATLSSLAARLSPAAARLRALTLGSPKQWWCSGRCRGGWDSAGPGPGPGIAAAVSPATASDRTCRQPGAPSRGHHGFSPGTNSFRAASGAAALGVSWGGLAREAERCSDRRGSTARGTGEPGGSGSGRAHNDELWLPRPPHPPPAAASTGSSSEEGSVCARTEVMNSTPTILSLPRPCSVRPAKSPPAIRTADASKRCARTSWPSRMPPLPSPSPEFSPLGVQPPDGGGLVSGGGRTPCSVRSGSDDSAASTAPSTPVAFRAGTGYGNADDWLGSSVVSASRHHFWSGEKSFCGCTQHWHQHQQQQQQQQQQQLSSSHPLASSCELPGARLSPDEMLAATRGSLDSTAGSSDSRTIRSRDQGSNSCSSNSSSDRLLPLQRQPPAPVPPPFTLVSHPGCRDFRDNVEGAHSEAPGRSRASSARILPPPQPLIGSAHAPLDQICLPSEPCDLWPPSPLAAAPAAVAKVNGDTQLAYWCFPAELAPLGTPMTPQLLRRRGPNAFRLQSVPLHNHGEGSAFSEGLSGSDASTINFSLQSLVPLSTTYTSASRPTDGSSPSSARADDSLSAGVDGGGGGVGLGRANAPCDAATAASELEWSPRLQVRECASSRYYSPDRMRSLSLPCAPAAFGTGASSAGASALDESILSFLGGLGGATEGGGDGDARKKTRLVDEDYAENRALAHDGVGAGGDGAFCSPPQLRALGTKRGGTGDGVGRRSANRRLAGVEKDTVRDKRAASTGDVNAGTSAQYMFEGRGGRRRQVHVLDTRPPKHFREKGVAGSHR